MRSGGTFREYIDFNKRSVLEFLRDDEFVSTNDIYYGYRGEKDMYQIRKALNELEKENLVEFEIRYVNSKYWRLTNPTK